MKINEIVKNEINQFLTEWQRREKEIDYNDDDKIELVNDKNVINRGNFPIKRQGKVFWVSRSMVVTLYAFCKNEQGKWCLLASKRGPEMKNGNLWNVVCGFLEYGDTLEECAVREAYEETGVKISKNSIKRININSARRRGNVSVMFMTILNGEISKYPTSIANCEEGEITEARWIPLEELDNYSWMSKQNEKAKSLSLRLPNNLTDKNNDMSNLIALLDKVHDNGEIADDKYLKIIKLLK